ncbi:MAG: LPS export ABC transporter periplasmic protein LptC [Fimbriimonas sp.]
MPTPATKKKLLLARNAGLILALIVGMPYLYSKTLDYVRSDAFASLRGSGSPSKKPSVGIELGKADIRHYRGQKLLSKAMAGRVAISADRRNFELYDVTNGIYNSDKGSMEFAAREATWNAPLKTLFINKEVHIKNKDADLRTSQLSFSERTGIIEAKKEISGKLYGGDVRAVTLRYNSNTGAFVAGPTSWNGMVKLKVQDGGVTETPSLWKMKGDDVTYGGKDNQVMTMSDATGTDNEIIVKAPKLEWNRKTDVVVGTGGARYFGPEANIVSDKITIYRKEKRAVLEGHVRMLVKPESEQDKPGKEEPMPEFKLLDVEKVNVKPASAPKTEADKKAIEDLRSNETMKKYPTQVAADFIEYWYGKGNRKADIKGNPQARQDFTTGMWRHIWTDTAKYDGEKDLMTLFAGGNAKARMKNSYGDDAYTPEYFIVSTKKDDETFSGKKIEGEFYSTDEPEKKTDDKTTTPPPVKTTGGGGAKSPEKPAGG